MPSQMVQSVYRTDFPALVLRIDSLASIVWIPEHGFLHSDIRSRRAAGAPRLTHFVRPR